MFYAKRVKDNAVVALYTYDFEPTFASDSGMVVITEEEYNELYKTMCPSSVVKPNAVAELQKENAVLNAKVQALTESTQFLEECIVEMAEIVYA